MQNSNYKLNSLEVKESITSQCLWPDVYSKYPELNEAVAKPGKHITCPFHRGEGDFLFQKDAFTSHPTTTSAVAICTCGKFSHYEVFCRMEGFDVKDIRAIQRLAEYAGIGESPVPGSAKPVKPPVQQAKNDQSPPRKSTAPTQSFKNLISRAQEGAHGAVAQYLRNRGLGDVVGKFPWQIRSLPSETYYHLDDHKIPGNPVMLAMIQDPAGKILGCQRIYLTSGGKKLKPYWDKNTSSLTLTPPPKPENPDDKPDLPLSCKKVMKTCEDESVSPGAVHFGEPEDRLIIAEGVESSLAVVVSYEDQAVWSTVSAAFMPSTKVPDRVKTVIIPADKDASKAGQIAAEKLAERLVAEDKDRGVYIVYPKRDIPEGETSIDWLDILVLDGKQAIVDAMTNLPEPYQPEKKEPDTNVVPFTGNAAANQDTPREPYRQSLEQPYKALGYNGENVYVMTRKNQQVRAITYANLSKNQLLSIASYYYWKGKHPKFNAKGENTGPNYDLCTDQVDRQCTEAGVYDPSIIRGRGFTNDNGRLVRHVGDRLIVDGQAMDMFGFDSEYTYEKLSRLPVGDYPPLTREEAQRVEEACGKPFWKDPAYPILFLGWCFIAAFCGALSWRPHIWVHAPAGSGKSTLIIPIMDALIGKLNMEKFDHVSTEAGIRQKIKNDAKPVIIEEADAKTEMDKKRLVGIMGLSRNCSTNNDIQTAKGTPGGAALTYSGCSSFCYLSVKDALELDADKTRTTCLELVHQKDASKVDERVKELNELLSIFEQECYSERIIAFLTANWKMLQHNIAVFRLAAGRQLRSPRYGDQYGTMLAGYWTVTRQTEISEEEAVILVASLKLNSMVEDHDGRSDEQRCLDQILALDLRVEVHKTHTLTIGEAIDTLAGPDYDFLILIGSEFGKSEDDGGNDALKARMGAIKAINRALRKHGIIYQLKGQNLYGCEGEGIYIANNCQYLKTRMEKTEFSRWSTMLKRLDNAQLLPRDKYLKVCGKSGKAVFIEM